METIENNVESIAKPTPPPIPIQLEQTAKSAEWQARFEAVLKASNQLFYSWNVQTQQVLYLGDYQELLQYSPKELTGSYNFWDSLIHPDDRADVFDNFSLAKQHTNEKFQLEYRIRRKDGSYIYISDNGLYYFDTNGEIAGREGIVSDISRRKGYEEALFYSEQQFKAIAEKAPDVITRINRNLEYVFINPVVGEITDLPSEYFIGKKPVERGIVFNAEKLGEWEKTVRKVFATGQELTFDSFFDTHFDKLKGEKRYYQTRFVPEYNRQGEVEFVMGFSRDVTDFVKADAQLRDSENQLRRVIDANLIGIVTGDNNGIITEANPAFLEMLGYSRQEVLNNQVSWRELTPPEYKESDEKIAKAVRQGEKIAPYEKEFLHKSGKRVPTMLSLTALQPESGQTVAFLQDLTERQKTEATQRFLTQATAILNSTLDFQTVLDSLGRLIVPELADWCTIDIAENLEVPPEQTQLVEVAIAHLVPEKERLVSELREKLLPDTDDSAPMVQAFRSGQPILIPEIPAELIDLVTEDLEARRILRELKMISALHVPLIARGRKLGVLTLNTSADSGRILGERDLAITQDLTQRAAIALDNAILYQSEQQARRLAEKAAKRTASLQDLTMAFSQALTPAEVAQVVVTQGASVLGASSGMVVELDNSQSEPRLRIVVSAGFPDKIMTEWQSFPLSAQVPFSEAIKEKHLILVESVTELLQKYDFNSVSAHTNIQKHQAWAAVPLQVQDRVIGAIGFSFKEAKHFTQEDRDFILTLANGCALALERARLYEAEQKSHREAEQARDRLAFLAEIRNLLSDSLDYVQTLQNVVQLVVPRLADWCVVHVLDEENKPRQVAIAHQDPARVAVAREYIEKMEKLFPYDPSKKNWLLNPIYTSETEIYSEITEEFLRNVAENDTQLAVLKSIGFKSIMLVPLVAHGRTLGVIRFAITESAHRYDDIDLPLAQEIARYVAIAVDNAHLYEQTQRAVQLRNEFLSVAAHELKTPITSLKGYSQLINRQLAKIGTVEPERLQRLLTIIDAQSDKLSHLVGQLLDVSRLESGKMVLNRVPVNISEMVTNLANNAQMMLTSPDKHQIEVTFDPTSSDPIMAMVDPIRFEQVVTNLVNNAIKYSPDGGNIIIEVKLDRVLNLTVADQGIGVAMEHRERLFERFYQAQSGAYVGGMGLGLYISRQIIELHNGSIEAEFPEEGGSKFTIRVPVS